VPNHTCVTPSVPELYSMTTHSKTVTSDNTKN